MRLGNIRAGVRNTQNNPSCLPTLTYQKNIFSQAQVTQNKWVTQIRSYRVWYWRGLTYQHIDTYRHSKHILEKDYQSCSFFYVSFYPKYSQLGSNPFPLLSLSETLFISVHFLKKYHFSCASTKFGCALFVQEVRMGSWKRQQGNS